MKPLDYLPALLAGDPTRLEQLFAAEPLLDDPRAGRIQGRPALHAFAHESTRLLKERAAQAVHLRTTETPQRVAEEWLLLLKAADGSPAELPVALVGERASGGLLALRVYHVMWPFVGWPVLRGALLEGHALPLIGVVERYQRALAEGDLEAVVACFEEDALFREPSGASLLYRGRASLRRNYAGLFAAGGLPLAHCSVTDDGVCCALEYNVVRWGKDELTPQAGVAFYERGKSGLLAAARVYDDVTPPQEVVLAFLANP